MNLLGASPATGMSAGLDMGDADGRELEHIGKRRLGRASSSTSPIVDSLGSRVVYVPTSSVRGFVSKTFSCFSRSSS